MAGTLISSMLRLTGAEWRRPITRMAEGITLFALLVAGPMVIIDMGRPDRLLHVFMYGRLQSPILWDISSLTTYMAGSVLFLYLPMIPDMAILRDCGLPFPAWRCRLYRILALGWHGTPEQHRRLEKLMAVMSIIIIPVAVSIHTVTAWCRRCRCPTDLSNNYTVIWMPRSSLITIGTEGPCAEYASAYDNME